MLFFAVFFLYFSWLYLLFFAMNPDFGLIIIWIIIWCIVGYLIAKLYFMVKIKKQRSDAVTRSRNVVLGHVNEKIAPLLPNFPYFYKDLVFLWKGVDYLVFDWLSKGNLNKIVFLEIKTWISTLNRNEQMVRDCVNQKRVSYEIWKQ
jgi:predicted Holliday junction resolvase-like endonuclease